MGETEMTARRRWVIFLVTVIGSVSVAISQFKVTGTMPAIIGEFGIDRTTAGLLMSIPSLANLLIALPGGAIVRKFGARNAFIVTVVVCFVFNIAGALVTDFNLLLVTRFFEGLSLGMVFVVPPVIFAQTFPAEKRGLPMSLWAIWSSCGTLIILNLCNVVTPLYGWHANWWVAAAFLGVASLLCILFLKMPKVASAPVPVSGKSAAPLSNAAVWSACLKNPTALCTCLVLFASIFIISGYTTYYTTFLTQARDVSASDANALMTIPTYLMIFIALTFGFVLNKVANKDHPKLQLAGVCLCLVGALGMWTLPTVAGDLAAVLFMAVGMQCVGPLVHNIIPEAVDPSAVPIGMGMLSFGSGLGAMVAPIVCGRVVDASAGNWAMLAIPSGIVAAIGIGAAVVVAATLPAAQRRRVRAMQAQPQPSRV